MGEGINGAKDVVRGGVQGIGIFDDVAKSMLKVSAAKREKPQSVGMVIDGSLGLDPKAVHDDSGAAPLEEGFLD